MEFSILPSARMKYEKGTLITFLWYTESCTKQYLYFTTTWRNLNRRVVVQKIDKKKSTNEKSQLRAEMLSYLQREIIYFENKLSIWK